MRAGRVVGLSNLKQEDRAQLVRLIVGAELPPPDTRHGTRGAPRVSVRDLVIHRQNGTVAVDRVSFDLHAGEIIGLCGVEGNGQTELLQVLAGMRPPRSGEVTYTLGRSIVNADAATLRRSGVAHIPEDRLQYALVSPFNLTLNWLLRKLSNQRLVTWGLLRLQAAAKATARSIEANDVRASGPRARAVDLSGGNQQKFVIGRELGEDIRVILAGHPTRGLDIRTVVAIRNRLVAERARGVAVMLLSADLGEVWDLADRVMVMARGRLRGPVPVGETSLAEIGHWMTAP
jgi:simple sugar transport system ATP-binding protein